MRFARDGAGPFAVWLVCFFSLSALAADLVFPALTGRVVDEAGLLSPPTQARLEQELAAHERLTGQQVVVATVRSLQGAAIEEYGYQLGRSWGIGAQGKNTGAILLVAPADRQVRIEVGYGLEGTLTDALSRTIIERDILPQFRAGQMERGVVTGTLAMLRALGGRPEETAAPAIPPPRPDSQSVPPLGIILFFLILFFLRSRGGRRRRGLWGVPMAGPIIWHGGGRGGGGGIDPFRGGGGSFGGGGASGRW
jgi:uncharacterized protein